MANEAERITFAIPDPELKAALDRLKRDEYWGVSYSEMIRDLLRYGIALNKQKNAGAV